MLASTPLVFASLIALANAHFQLQFPSPRGAFVEDSEPTFCDGYDNPATRTVFPLSGGVYSLNSEHTAWSLGVSLTTKANASLFSDFNPIIPFFKASGEGIFCFNLDFSATNASVTAGQNVTLEFVFDGGDGQLYQCADLTLSSNVTVPASTACNGTFVSMSASGFSASQTASSPSGSNTAPAASGSSTGTTKPSSATPTFDLAGGYLALLVGLIGAAAGAVVV
ncbi:hypothetical protein C8F04DRAFT_79019 [Mycena alexandri]|uniref:Copper acquisition factor BIM1-like domain-containing protein n=1 Tax=Mycena alexandri TaxID=1745969 RepID=A0AAD6TAJ5_9AGAR|nr:hypothetical protein C8F04DRAFT_79019 [Mycena alexandri]